MTAIVTGACGGEPALPDLTGRPLDQAKTAAADVGFDDVVSHDVPQTRAQWQDANWRVGDQTPSPGPAGADTRVDLGVVRLEETSPGTAAASTSTTAPPTSTPATTPSPPTDVDTDRPYVPRRDRDGDGNSSEGSNGSGTSGDGSSSDGSSGGAGAYYADCDAAEAAGAAPLSAGRPGYRPGLDRNKDGVACEWTGPCSTGGRSWSASRAVPRNAPLRWRRRAALGACPAAAVRRRGRYSLRDHPSAYRCDTLSALTRVHPNSAGGRERFVARAAARTLH